MKVDGVITSFPESPPVTILKQDGSSATVELRQEWFPTVDSIYYEFQGDTTTRSSDKRICRHETSVEEGDLYDTITIACDSLLDICLSDEGQLMSEGNTATHCQPELPGIHAEPETMPTICYSMQVQCENLSGEAAARDRRLRGTGAK